MKKQTRKSLVKKLDTVFSEYIRKRDNYTCFTCGLQGSEKDGIMQNGHLFSRVSYSTRWNEINSHCQCRSCNMTHEFDFEIYRRAFVEKYGQEKYDFLYVLHKSVFKITNSEIIILIAYYKKMLNDHN